MTTRPLPALAVAGSMILASAAVAQLVALPGDARATSTPVDPVEVQKVVDARPIPHTSPALDPKSDADPREARRRGAKWLVAHQHADGGWGAGSWGQTDAGAPSDVATTCVSVVALLRDAHGTDAHRDAVRRGVMHVVKAVEASPDAGPRLATPEGTQPQHKLGPLVDTHLAALMLGEVAGTLDAETNARVDRALDKAVRKVQAAQNADGSFESAGWAPVLSTSIAAQGLVRARELGKDVAPSVLDRSDDFQAKGVDVEGKKFDASASAGVELYAVASSLRGNAQAAARGKEANAAPAQVAAERVAADADGRLVAGFGSIGGEEMLAYTMISDTLAEQGGDPWKAWEVKIGRFLSATQNADGSWTGHHCITSTPFVTASAVMGLAAGDAAQAKAARKVPASGAKATAATTR